jgi:uncharacterized protein YuzE
MEITYCAEHSLLYVRLRDGEIAKTIELAAEIYVDLDAAGAPLGVEFLNAAADFLPFLEAHGGRLDAESVHQLLQAAAPAG